MTVSDGGIVSHSRVATVVLNVLDDNDEVPTFIRSSYSFHVPENRPAGSAVGRIRATDADLSAQHRAVFYSLEGHDSRAFRVAAQTGELFSRVALDREAQSAWRFPQGPAWRYPQGPRRSVGLEVPGSRLQRPAVCRQLAAQRRRRHHLRHRHER